MHDIYWSGNNFELNLSFGNLRDFQWQRLINALWQREDLHGPLVSRYVPGEPTPETTSIQFPAPTDTLTQHATLNGQAMTVGIDVLVTRSLFECITISTPNGMFAIEPGEGTPDPYKVEQVYNRYKQIALALHESVPFHIASIGWNRDCQLLAELESDQEKCEQFFADGHFFATDDTIIRLGRTSDEFEEVTPNLRWAAGSSTFS